MDFIFLLVVILFGGKNVFLSTNQFNTYIVYFITRSVYWKKNTYYLYVQLNCTFYFLFN